MTQNLDRFKFRVWNASLKKMAEGISFGIENNFAIVRYDGSENPKENTEITISDNIVMQSTGLKDKNGKLIFEGDLAKVWDNTVNDFRLLEIVWDNEKCGFDIYQQETNDPIFGYMDEFCGSYELDHELQSLEIIGNIYENREFLNK